MFGKQEEQYLKQQQVLRMSTSYKLNRNATKISIHRYEYVGGKKTVTKLCTLDFNTEHFEFPDSLSQLEQARALAWIDNQKSLIAEAYRVYAREGYVGGVPVVSESGKYNKKFKNEIGCNLNAPAYSFLGCLKGARKISMKANSANSIEFKKIIDDKQLPAISKCIISTLCQKLIADPEQMAHKALSDADIAQVVESNLLISKFITKMKINQAQVREDGVEKRVDDFFDELLNTPEGYLIGKRLKVGTLLTQRERPEPKPDPVLEDVLAPISEEEREIISTGMVTERFPHLDVNTPGSLIKGMRSQLSKR
ncbi:hypothetical protein BM527_04525 [Alteromonas sp. Mex14]|nr:hypothetical protein BM527_04525 [Alteromonas sp. Mex14]